MKKTIAILLVLVMLAGVLSSCGQSTAKITSEPTPDKTSEPTSEPQPTTVPSETDEPITHPTKDEPTKDNPTHDEPTTEPTPDKTDEPIITPSSEEPIYTPTTEEPDVEAVIKTKYADLRVTERFLEGVKYEITDGSAYEVKFTAKADGVKLFSLIFGGVGDFLLGTLMLDEYTVVYFDAPELDSASPNYMTYAGYQESCYDMINRLINDYPFEINEIVEKEDTSTFDIVTSVVTLKYPNKWKEKVQIEVTENGVKFSTNGTPLFSLMFVKCDGFLLGGYGKTPIYLISYPVSDSEQLSMQEDINVIFAALMNDSEFNINYVPDTEPSETDEPSVTTEPTVTAEPTEDTSTFDIVTSVVTFKYPAKWQSKVKVDVTSDGVKFSAGGVKLFDIMFVECDGILLGGYDGTPLYMVDYDVTSVEHEAMLMDINVLINALMTDSKFDADFIPEEDTSTFDIVTSVVTFKYPAKWQSKVKVDVTSDGVKFSASGVKLFDIMFVECDGYLLGGYDGTPLYLVSYSVTEAEQLTMQEDVNVLVNALSSDSKFSSEFIPKEDTSTFDIVTSVVTLKYPAKWQSKVKVDVTADGVKFSSSGVNLFDIMFTNIGYQVGTYNGTPICISVYDNAFTDEQIMMQDDLNVIIDNLMTDSKYVPAE